MTNKPDPYVVHREDFGEAIASLVKQFFEKNPGLTKFEAKLKDGSKIVIAKGKGK